jgi:hypothetical protein
MKGINRDGQDGQDKELMQKEEGKGMNAREMAGYSSFRIPQSLFILSILSIPV